MENLPPDPLLKAGAFIDTSYEDSTSANPDPKPSEPSTPVHYSSGTTAATSDATPRTNSMITEAETPDWLPDGWQVEFRMRTSGATAGHRDKYYYCPNSKRRFRSKKEVMNFLETGETVSKRKKIDDTNGESKPASNKRKKTAKTSVENFNFHDVPEKVKWVMTDIYQGSWRPLLNGVERVSEATKQEWTAAYTFLSLQKNGNAIE